jgi:hypothetical protein
LDLYCIKSNASNSSVIASGPRYPEKGPPSLAREEHHCHLLLVESSGVAHFFIHPLQLDNYDCPGQNSGTCSKDVPSVRGCTTKSDGKRNLTTTSKANPLDYLDLSRTILDASHLTLLRYQSVILELNVLGVESTTPPTLLPHFWR